MTAIAHMAAMPSFWMVAARGKTTDRRLQTVDFLGLGSGVMGEQTEDCRLQTVDSGSGETTDGRLQTTDSLGIWTVCGLQSMVCSLSCAGDGIA